MKKERIVYDYRCIDKALAFKLGKVVYLDAKMPLSHHIHPNSIEIVYFVSGEQLFCIGDEKYHIKGGNILISKPAEPHSTGGLDVNMSKFFFLIVDVSLFQNHMLFYEDEGNRLYDAFNQIENYLFHGDSETLKLFETLFSMFTSESVLKKTNILGHFWHLMENVLICTDNSLSKDEDIDDILDYIHSHIQDYLTVDYLASLSPWSVSSFKVKFREYVGYTPKSYLMIQKVELAKVMLSNSSKSITEIAYELSFASSQHFSLVFKRLTRQTPREFRKQSKTASCR